MLNIVFSGVYASLCVRHTSWLISVSADVDFGRVMLDVCQGYFFGFSWEEKQSDMCLRQSVLGNCHFVASLLVRGALDPWVLFSRCNYLLERASMDLALEALAVLLTGVCSGFTGSIWPGFELLELVFLNIRVTMKSTSLSTRIRVLLQNVLDLEVRWM